MRTRRGFTLIELLVVIAIITSLLAILLPSLNQAIAVTESAVCMSNQKQVGVAMHTYIAENYGVFPAYRFAENTSAGTTGADIQYHWFDQLRRLVTGSADVPDDFGLYRCPTDEKYQYDANRISYGYNYTNFGDVYYATKIQPSITQVTKPGESILTGDSVGVYVSGAKYWGSVISPVDIVPMGHNHYQLEARHPNGTASILFADMHVGAHDAEHLNYQYRNPGGADYWWDVNEGPRYLYAN